MWFFEKSHLFSLVFIEQRVLSPVLILGARVPNDMKCKAFDP